MSATKGTEVDQWVQAHAQLSPEARKRWEVGEVRTIRNTVAPKLNPSEFQMMMSMAAKYDLDPLAHEIWGSKGEGRDGREGRVLILVGRDGLLKVARRDATYAGFDSDVVRKNDTFRVKRSKEGREIIHEYEGGDEERGEIVGAWAQVYQKGFHDTYFFAPWKEYFPNRTNDRSPWSKQPSVMIQKCALSLCLRLAFNLSGVVAEEEAARAFEDSYAAEEGASAPSLADAVAHLPESLRDRLYAAYGEAARLRPGIVTPAAVQMSVSGQSQERVEAYIAEIERANEAAAYRAEKGEPADAEVVPDEDLGGGSTLEEGRSPEGEVSGPAALDTERIAALEARERGLMEDISDVEQNPGGHADTDARLSELSAELDLVQQQLGAARDEAQGSLL